MDPQTSPPAGSNPNPVAIPQPPVKTGHGYGAVLLGTLAGAIVGGVINFMMSFVVIFATAGKLFLSCGDACTSADTNHVLSTTQILVVSFGDLVIIGCVSFGIYLALKSTRYAGAKETAILAAKIMGVVFLAGVALMLLAHSLVIYSSTYLIVFASALLSRYFVLRSAHNL